MAQPGAERRTSRGLTLLELMVALAIVAILSSLALPSFGAAAARARLKAAAEALAHDLAEARVLAAQRGEPVHIEAHTGTHWCWASTRAAGCDCHAATPCRIKATSAADHPGVSLQAAAPLRFEPGGEAAFARHGRAQLQLQSARGESLRVEVAPMGRARICAPDAAVAGYPAC